MHAEISHRYARLPSSEWRRRVAAHERRVRPWVDARLARASRGEDHPVYDFLFTYYSHRPGQLLRWSPGPGLILTGTEAGRFFQWREYTAVPDGVTLDVSRLTPKRIEAIAWIADLLGASRDRPARFGCYGLHEWAMLYEAEEIRHRKYPLRFSRRELGEIVRAQSICCSHYDAYRFFSPAARPLNRLRPEKHTRIDFEQAGCLHTNMDLYKWAYKLAPWTASELVADCFELACEIREIDMRASPYDLSSLGFAPIKIETADGKREYEARQKEFNRRSSPIRTRLIETCASVLDLAGAGRPPT